ncbi:hypothetical protein SAMN05192534_10767 [Alteribacillus persepolensis]|uniref:Uncharacterized protein n=1 Tax=Alteribacillus persepolensis TaxID=568899 RepID=A0A1G8DF49_9BACI|nr:hypothetical protein SAMN05192534_10767 [Alteribacillus persepolensis]
MVLYERKARELDVLKLKPPLHNKTCGGGCLLADKADCISYKHILFPYFP